MRIISQDGTIDMPYEYFSLTIVESLIVNAKVGQINVSSIYCHNISSPHGTKMAEYSSKEKAVRTMERLREAHREYIATVTTTQGIAQTLVLIENNEDNQKLSTNIAKGIKEIACFQFPKDDEVEV